MQLNHPSSFAHSPELHDTGDIAWRIDASDVIEVTNKQAPINAPCESNRSQEFVSLRLPITARTGDASASAIPHYGADDGRKLGEEDVLTVSFIQDPWDTRESGRKNKFLFFLKNNDFHKNQCQEKIITTNNINTTNTNKTKMTNAIAIKKKHIIYELDLFVL